MGRRTKVRKHKRKTKRGKRTTVRRHRRKVKKKQKEDLEQKFHDEITILAPVDDEFTIEVMKETYPTYNKFTWFDDVPDDPTKGRTTGIVPLELYEPTDKTHMGKTVYKLRK